MNEEMKKEDCKFCKELFTGDCNDSLIEHRLQIFNSEDLYVGVDVFIMDDELELYMDDPSGLIILKKKIRINYCPICGRKLEVK